MSADQHSPEHPQDAGQAGAEPDEDWLIESIERRVEAFDADAGEPAEAEIEAASPGAEQDGPPAG